MFSCTSPDSCLLEQGETYETEIHTMVSLLFKSDPAAVHPPVPHHPPVPPHPPPSTPPLPPSTPPLPPTALLGGGLNFFLGQDFFFFFL